MTRGSALLGRSAGPVGAPARGSLPGAFAAPVPIAVSDDYRVGMVPLAFANGDELNVRDAG